MTITDLPLPVVEHEAPTKTLINIAPLAAALIREQGWWDGNPANAGGDHYCIFLGLRKVYEDVTGDEGYPPWVPAVMDQMGLPPTVIRFRNMEPVVNYCPSDIFRWNDEHTAQEVIDMLDNLTIMVEV